MKRASKPPATAVAASTDRHAPGKHREPYRIRFYGTRGSVPTPGPDTLRHGGNTSCLHLEISKTRHIIFDAGTGLRVLGARLAHPDQDLPHVIDLFMTHYHFDHIQGIPFFIPLFRPNSWITFRGHKPPPEALGARFGAPAFRSMRGLLEHLVSPPYFPTSLATCPSRCDYIEVGTTPIPIEDLTITPIRLNHPQGATGYKIERRGRSVLYATDYEPGVPELDRALEEAARGVDLLIADSHFTPEELVAHAGWGHGSWREAAQLAARAGAKQLLLYHHHPLHHDAWLEDIVRAAREIFPATDATREGMEFFL